MRREIGGRGRLGRVEGGAEVAEAAPRFGGQADFGLVEIADEIGEVAREAAVERRVVDRVVEEGVELFERGFRRDGGALRFEEEAHGGVGDGRIERGDFVAEERVEFFEEARELRGGARGNGRASRDYRRRRLGVSCGRCTMSASALTGGGGVGVPAWRTQVSLVTPPCWRVTMASSPGRMIPREAAGHDTIVAVFPRDEGAEGCRGRGGARR